jgi:hypothetical protein
MTTEKNKKIVKYTLQIVKEIFPSNNCTLISHTYLQKMKF